MSRRSSAFTLAFGNVEPTGQRWLVGLDVSGSMVCGRVAGVPGLTPRVASAALAQLWATTERACSVVAFADSLKPFPIRAGEPLASVVERAERLPFGGTDCALPMLYALERTLAVDVFAILTDSETWYGQVHPMAALRRYREHTGIPAKLVVVGLLANRVSLADPEDAGTLDVVGFDTATPQLIAAFAAGDLFAPAAPGRTTAPAEPADEA